MAMSVIENSKLFREDLAGGGTWSHVLKRHNVLRIVDLEGGANVSALFYNAGMLLERATEIAKDIQGS